MNALPLPGADLDATKAASSPFAFDERILSSHLQKRYTTISIPATYASLNSGPRPGVVVGIVLGTVGGVCLLLYLTFMALNPGGLARGGSSITDEEVVVRSRRTPSRSRSEVIEVVEERDYRRRPRRDRDRVVVEESTTETETTHESRDFIEVVEEESSGLSTMSPPRRPKSYRSGIRRVDPHEYGGGGSSRGSFY
ncbi:uncharacterized protein N7498_005588 [Penicillium cinerascens]|uniref:Uncharacterized protein n=1 Tax=Penicillium cinerascens TaxID=70096 RepID=A0A9W9T0B3_9EURO|nr:uncharacterized protein N7498_005588 [Penicillium cinerascens]KAJ5204709.1 hypothetical protein N7498_005588 [Penicillium cinerascens]